MADALEGGAYDVIASFPDGLPEDALQVECGPEHDRKPAAESDESLLEATWRARVAANPALFNGTKFRFAGVRARTEAGVGPTLLLGLTDYRSFLGTNCAPHWERLLAASAGHLASPLGNAAVVETADRRVVLLRRGAGVGEAPNSVVMPGGHPEPEMLGVRSLGDWGQHEPAAFAVRLAATEGAAADSAPPAPLSWPAAVRRELWEGMAREIEEETGVPRAALGPLRCIGFCRRVLNHRPDIIFHVRCALTASEVAAHYAGSQDGSAHRDESTALFTLERHELVRRALDANDLPMPGCHRGGVHLYREHLAAASSSS